MKDDRVKKRIKELRGEIDVLTANLTRGLQAREELHNKIRSTDIEITAKKEAIKELSAFLKPEKKEK